MHSDVYESTWFKLGMVIDLYRSVYCWTLRFSTVTSKTFIQGHRSVAVRKQKFLHQLSAISHSFQSVWMEVGLLLRHGVMNLILILSCSFSIQGRELTDSVILLWKKQQNKTKNDGLKVALRNWSVKIQIFGDQFLSLGIVIETTVLCILISVWMALTYI